MRVRAHRECPAFDSFRAAYVQSLFNVEKAQAQAFSVDVELPVEDKPWRIGLVVGPSGSGKTTVGTELWPDVGVYPGAEWPKDAPIIDAIAPGRDIDAVTGALASVGLGSVPSWLRPFHVLSNGERFRAELARLVVEAPPRVVIDEFTSVVDRQIARIGAGAFAKAWRRNPVGQAVCLACHYDIEDWLQPDWILDTRNWSFRWRSVQRSPSIGINIFEASWTQWWPLFEPYHYLKLPRPLGTFYVAATEDGSPVACVLVSTGAGLKWARMTRLVVLPEWQGAGVGVKFITAIAERWRTGLNRYGVSVPTSITTSHPGLCAAIPRSKGWRADTVSPFGVRQKVAAVSAGAYGGHMRSIASYRYGDS